MLNMGDFAEFLAIVERHFGARSCFFSATLPGSPSMANGAESALERTVRTAIVTLEPPETIMITLFVADPTTNGDRSEYWEGIIGAPEFEAHVRFNQHSFFDSNFNSEVRGGTDDKDDTRDHKRCDMHSTR